MMQLTRAREASRILAYVETFVIYFSFRAIIGTSCYESNTRSKKKNLFLKYSYLIMINTRNKLITAYIILGRSKQILISIYNGIFKDL